MDNLTRLKYLNALIKTISNVDDTLFSQRVNSSRNDYADWIRRNLSDDDLARRISAEPVKSKMLEILRQTASTTPVSVPVSVAQNSAASTATIAQNATITKNTIAQNTNMQNAATVAVTAMPIDTGSGTQQILRPAPVVASQNMQQSSSQKSKYLGALIKTINGLSDEVFRQRVNPDSNQYADWILKNMHDQELYSKVKGTMEKTKMIELLTLEMNPAGAAANFAASHASNVSNVSTSTTTQASGSILPVKTELSSKYPSSRHPKKVDDATESKYLNALIKTVNSLPDEVFISRVNPSKNEYAEWIMKNVGDEALYSSMKSKMDKASLIDVLRSEMDVLKGVSSHAVSSSVSPSMIAPAASAALITPVVAPVVSPVVAPVVSPAVVSPVDATSIPTVTPAASTAAVASVSNEKDSLGENLPISLHTETVSSTATASNASSSVSSSASDDKLNPQELFKRLKQSRDARLVSGKSIPKVAPILNNTAVLSRNYNQDIDLIKMNAREIIEKLHLIDYSQKSIAIEEDLSVTKKQVKRLKTGVLGFDDMIGSGIPAGSVILASGGPGSGKTTFCIQMLGWAAERGEKCLFISLEETTERLIEHMESYGLNPKRYIAEGTLVIQQQDPFKISRSIEALLAYGRGELLIDIDNILDIIPKGFTPDRVVIDSLSAIASAFNESNTAYRIYINQLINLLSKTGATSFLITEVQGIENIGHGLVEEFLADGVIVFYNLQRGNIKQSALEILKMRAVNHEKKIVPFEFVEGKGLIVYPLEKVFL